MAASGSTGNSKQEDKGTGSQSEQENRDHSVHQALLINAALH